MQVRSPSGVAGVHYTFDVLHGFLEPSRRADFRVTRNAGAAADESVHVHWAETDAAERNPLRAFGRGAPEGKVTIRLKAR